MTALIFRVLLLAAVGLTPLLSIPKISLASDERISIPADVRLPRPCLVPPVPQKKGLPPQVGGPIRHDSIFRAGRRLDLRDLGGGPGGTTRLKVLAIRVDFEETPMDSSQAYFERLTYFLSQYYEHVSDGQLALETALAPSVYRMPESMEYYGLDDSIGVRQALLSYDAVQAADDEIDFGQFDRVIIFHSGPGQESDVKDDSREQLWSVFFRNVDFAFYLPRPGAERGIATDDRWPNGDTLFVESTAIFPETESQDGFVFSCVGVVCHEFGHALGLPDLYDTVALEDQIFAESQGIGSWDLMASGTWNANGFVPAEFSAWSKVFLGWIQPRLVESGGTVSLEAIETDRRQGVVKVPLSEDEYLLIENRQQDLNADGRFNFDESDSSGCFYQPSGDDSTLICLFDFYEDSYAGAEWDYWLPGEGTGSGLLIWHIDDSIINDNLEYNTVNANPLQKGIDLEEADGIQDMDSPAGDIDAFGSPFDTWKAGWADRFAPDTEPNTDGYHGIRSGVTIDQISAPGPSMSFRVSFGDVNDEWPVFTVAPTGSNHVGLADMDGDSEREIVVADRGGNLYVLNPDGSAAWTGGGAEKHFVALGTAVGTPLLADVDGDERTDLLVLADDGRIFGFRGGSGDPMGAANDGLLLTMERPAPNTELWAFDLRPNRPGVEFGFGSAVQLETGLSRTALYAVSLGGEPILAGTASLVGGAGPLPPVILDLSGIPADGQLELLASVRGGTPDEPRGSVQLHSFNSISGVFIGGEYAIAPLPDTLIYSAPVAGDLDRDGRTDVVFTASDGSIYAYTPVLGDAGAPGFEPLPGWPRPVFASGNDAISLADVDGNGYIEVLVLETGGVLHVLNYHGEALVSLPETVPSETRYFIEPQLAPLVTDLTSDGRPELVLPLRDGQVFAVRSDGRRLSPGYFGGGQYGSSPAVDDLDGDGSIELVTATHYLGAGRIDVHPLGQAAGAPVWGMHRRSGTRDGTLVVPEGTPVVNGPRLSDPFVMPNPARDVARIHYRVGEDIDQVAIEIVDLLGRGVRRLEGTSFAGTDNAVVWDLNGRDGQPVAPGVYLARIEARGPGGTLQEILKFAVMK